MTLSKTRMFDYTVKVFGLALLLIASYLVYYSYSSPTKVGAAAVVVTNSNTAYNSAAYYPLTSYGYMRGQVNWPQRWEGCVPAGNGTPYKTFPWLPSNTAVGTAGYPSGYDGNSITMSGNCQDRYVDGGGSSGGWASPGALGGWAYAGGGSGFGGSQNSYFTSIISCNSLYGGGAPIIWGQGGPDNNDQAYGGGGLMAQNGWSSTVPANNVQAYSNGTTFFRNNFALTTDQYNAIAAGSAIRFYGIADDWMQVYLNGNLIGSTYYTGQSITIDLSVGYFLPAGSPNVLAIQVSDKTIWSPYGPGSSRGSGLCYNMTADLPDTPPPPPECPIDYTGIYPDCVAPPPVEVSCESMTVSPTNLDPYSRFIVKTGVEYSRAYAPVNPRISLALAPLVPFNGNANPATPLISGTAATATFGTTANGLGPTNSTGVFIATWTYSDSGGLTAACTDKFTVVNRPYLTIYGGDAVVGDSPTTAKSCYTKSNGGAYGWNSLTPTFKGAGAQYAVMALGTIQEFASNLGAGAPDKLAFANTDYGPPDLAHDVAAGLFGGKFGATSTPCDFISDLKVAQQPGLSVTSLFFAPFSVSGEIVKYAKGDVYIANNVVYSGTSWATVSAIPSFKLVVEGDIYVDNNVTQLDGLYVALYDAAANKGGNIYTCATSIGNDVKPGTTGPSGFYNTCKTKLTVNGAFIAKQVHFLRTDGTLGQATADNPVTGVSSAAEVFNYSPELWLPRNTVPTPNGRYDVITGLPPVL